MKIIPTIYLSQGKAVNLYKGKDSSEKKTYYETPLNIARKFQKAGASQINLVDLDGSAANRPIHLDQVENISKNISIPIQLAGGIRSIEAIEDILKRSIKSVVLGYGAIGIIKEAIRQFGPDCIYGGLKSNRSIIDTDVIQDKDIEVIQAARAFEKKGIKNLIFKDLDSEGTLHPNFDEVDRLISLTEMNIYVSGGIGSINDLKIMKRIGAKGALISKAFFEGILSFHECSNI